MTHKFQEGDTVISKEDTTDFLPAGSHGTVFCLYTTIPPAYEINFLASDGELYGAIRYEDELEAAEESLFLNAGQREAVSTKS